MQRRSLTVLPILAFVLALLMAAPAWAAPNLSITKEGPARVEPGEEFVYTIEVRNTGADPATVVEVTDRLPAGVTFVESDPAICTAAPDPVDPSRERVACTVGTLAAGGGRRTIELTVRAPADEAEITNRASVVSTETPTPENSNVVSTLVVADLVIEKLDDPDPVREEGLLLYTLRVTNRSDATVNDAVILDNLPLAEVDFVRVRSDDFVCEENGGLVRCDGSLGADRTGVVDIVVEPEGAGTVENTARVRDGTLVTDSATERTEVQARNTGGGGGTTTGGTTTGGTTTGGTTTGAVTTAQTTTPETTTSDTTTADAQSADELRRDDVRAAGFSCVEIVDISQSASRNQYNFSSARLQECLAREVIDDVKGDRLADTGGAPLLPIAASLLAGVGIFVGRALVSRRLR